MIIKPKNILITLSIFVIGFLFINNFVFGQTTNELEACKKLPPQQQRQCLIDYEKKVSGQINSIQKDIKNLQNQINYIDAQTENTEIKIAISEQEINLTNLEIQKTESEIEQIIRETAKTKNDLAEALKAFYEYDKQNIVKITLTQASLSSVVDEFTYIENIQKQMVSKLNKIKENKKNLEAKKLTLETRKKQLEEQTDSLNREILDMEALKRQRENLLTITQGDEAKYQAIMQKIKQEKTIVDDILRRIYEESLRNSTNIVTGSTGGYPYAGQCDQVDPWLFLTCQCTSYAAWKWNNWGYYWYNTQPGRGSAKYWPEIARTLGYSMGTSPRLRAIISWPWGTYGHVAIVENVYPDGSIRISEYNVYPLIYSERTIPPSAYSAATFIYPP